MKTWFACFCCIGFVVLASCDSQEERRTIATDSYGLDRPPNESSFFGFWQNEFSEIIELEAPDPISGRGGITLTDSSMGDRKEYIVVAQTDSTLEIELVPEDDKDPIRRVFHLSNEGNQMRCILHMDDVDVIVETGLERVESNSIPRAEQDAGDQAPAAVE